MAKFPHGEPCISTILIFTPTPHVHGAAIHSQSAGDILGHPSWPKRAARRANACLRPTCPDKVGEAEFARSSERGLRRVQNVVKAAKGMCRKPADVS
jgi:hypothetical protein